MRRLALAWRRCLLYRYQPQVERNQINSICSLSLLLNSKSHKHSHCIHTNTNTHTQSTDSHKFIHIKKLLRHVARTSRLTLTHTHTHRRSYTYTQTDIHSTHLNAITSSVTVHVGANQILHAIFKENIPGPW